MRGNYITAVLDELLEGKDPEVTLEGLKKVLEQKGHTRLYPSVLRGVARVLEARGTHDARVVVKDTAAYEKQKEAITAALKKLGTTEEPELQVDETIIGGFIAEAEGKQLDKSYKSKLVSLYRNLTK